MLMILANGGQRLTYHAPCLCENKMSLSGINPYQTTCSA